MAKSYIVTAPLATPYREDGSRVYIYQGAPFVGVREGEVERFLDLGFIAESDAVFAAPEPEPDAVEAGVDEAPVAKVTAVKKTVAPKPGN